MKPCAFFVDYCLQDFEWLKCLAREHNTASVGQTGQQAKDKTEAMEQWWWAAYDVLRGQAHPIADEPSVVNDVANYDLV